MLYLPFVAGTIRVIVTNCDGCFTYYYYYYYYRDSGSGYSRDSMNFVASRFPGFLTKNTRYFFTVTKQIAKDFCSVFASVRLVLRKTCEYCSMLLGTVTTQHYFFMLLGTVTTQHYFFMLLGTVTTQHYLCEK